jgi:hypothetical protein
VTVMPVAWRCDPRAAPAARGRDRSDWVEHTVVTSLYSLWSPIDLHTVRHTPSLVSCHSKSNLRVQHSMLHGPLASQTHSTHTQTKYKRAQFRMRARAVHCCAHNHKHVSQITVPTNASMDVSAIQHSHVYFIHLPRGTELRIPCQYSFPAQACNRTTAAKFNIVSCLQMRFLQCTSTSISDVANAVSQPKHPRPEHDQTWPCKDHTHSSTPSIA